MKFGFHALIARKHTISTWFVRPGPRQDRALFGHGSSETEPVAHEGEATAGASKHEDLDTLRTLLGEAEKGTVVWEEEDCEGAMVLPNIAGVALC